jgi:biotin synthase
MVMGFKTGRFYRGAKLPCVNLLMTYETGCVASCSYCGLSRKRTFEKHQSFIRVEWPTYSLEDIIQAISERTDKIKRVCVSMITHKRAPGDLREILKRFRQRLDIQISLLLSPSILTKDDLKDYKRLGADRIGIAVDAATPDLFDKHRGKEIGGPHKWEQYWKLFKDGIEIFGRDMVGAHFIVGLGETERQMCEAIEYTRSLGGVTHLFSFYPEAGSAMEHELPPPMGNYRRIQVFRYLRDHDLCSVENLAFDNEDRVRSFGINDKDLEKIINSGEPFKTSGCPDNATGKVACTRPFGNSPPGDEVRNLPYEANKDDIARIKQDLLSF